MTTGRDEAEGKHLSEDVRGDLRLFAFFVANGSLFASHHDIDTDDVEYGDLLLRRDDTIGQLFAIFLNVLPSDGDGAMPATAGSQAGYRASQWLRHACDPGDQILPPVRRIREPDESVAICWEVAPAGTLVPA